MGTKRQNKTKAKADSHSRIFQGQLLIPFIWYHIGRNYRFRAGQEINASVYLNSPDFKTILLGVSAALRLADRNVFAVNLLTLLYIFFCLGVHVFCWVFFHTQLRSSTLFLETRGVWGRTTQGVLHVLSRTRIWVPNLQMSRNVQTLVICISNLLYIYKSLKWHASKIKLHKTI